MPFSFQKMQASGNDFVIIDHSAAIPPEFNLTPELAAKICHRQFGIGCDQILWLKPGVAPNLAATVEILNADGSRAEMCGNGMRAIGVHLSRRGPKPGEKKYTVRVEGVPAPISTSTQPSTDAQNRSSVGTPIEVSIDLSDGFPEAALGIPRIIKEVDSMRGRGEFTRVEIGNPHAVFFVPIGLDELDLSEVGPEIETDRIFPHRTNVEFVEIIDRTKCRVRVWERGAGATLACGSGACAVVAAGEMRGLLYSEKKIEVILPGGSLFVRLERGWRDGKGRALLSGPVEDVFSGEWNVSAT